MSEQGKAPLGLLERQRCIEKARQEYADEIGCWRLERSDPGSPLLSQEIIELLLKGFDGLILGFVEADEKLKNGSWSWHVRQSVSAIKLDNQL